MIENYAAFTGFIINVICFCILLFFLTPKQIIEALRPRDWLTQLRYIILAMIIIALVTSIPGLIYLFYRSIGEDYEVLRNVVNISGQISKLASTLLLVLIFTYSVKEK